MYILYIFSLKLITHNIQIIQNSNLLFMFNLNYFNNTITNPIVQLINDSLVKPIT